MPHVTKLKAAVRKAMNTLVHLTALVGDGGEALSEQHQALATTAMVTVLSFNGFLGRCMDRARGRACACACVRARVCVSE